MLQYTSCVHWPETDGNISIVSKRPILSPLVSVSVSIEAFSESRYQSRYRSRGLSIFCKVLAEFLLSKVSVSVSVPVHFYGISISIGLDSGPQKVSVSVSVSIQGHKKYQYQYRLKISAPVCLWTQLYWLQIVSSMAFWLLGRMRCYRDISQEGSLRTNESILIITHATQ